MNKKTNKNKTKRNVTTSRIFTALYLVALLVTFFNVYPYIFDKKLNLNGDNADYYILGSAISQGDGYTNIHYSKATPANHFPPGYPVIVATTMKLVSKNVNDIKRVNGFFLILSVIALFYLFYVITDNQHLSFILATFILLNSTLLEFSTIMMSEISFLFFSILCLILVIKTDYKVAFYKNWKFFALLICVGISYYIRSAGLALVGGIALVYILNKNWKYLASFLGGFFVLALPWYLRGAKLGGNSYLDSLFWINPYRTELGKMGLTDWGMRIYRNFVRYVTHEIPTVTINAMNVRYNDDILLKEWIIGIVVVALIIWGIISLKKYRFLIFSYLLGSFGIMMLWPDVWFGTRFVLPIAPLLLFLMGNGLYQIITFILEKIKVKNKLVTNAIIPFCFLFFLPLFIPEIKTMHLKAKNVYPNNYKNYFELAQWANKNIPADAIVSCRKTSFFYLYSGRKVTSYAKTLDREEVVEAMKRSKVTHVVLEQLGYASTGRYLYPAIKRYPNKFKVIKHLKEPDTYLMEFKPETGYWGEFKDDKRCGHGTFHWDNGNWFEGQWDDNKRNGEGTFYISNGNSLTGPWKDDKMNGLFLLKNKDGKILEKAYYQNNQKTKVIKN